MKIIKEGKPYSVDIICTGKGNGGKGCGAHLRADRSDLRWFEEQVFPWRTQPAAVTARCPSCGATTDIPEAEWPREHTKLTKWTSAWRDGESD